jgi:hypothetical protein
MNGKAIHAAVSSSKKIPITAANSPPNAAPVASPASFFDHRTVDVLPRVLQIGGYMKTTNRLKPRAGRAVKAAGALNANHPDYFAQLAEISTSTVEHCTVAEFLNRCRVRNPDDIIRFGDKARKLADSLLLAWVTTTNDSLGVLRILPVPLMKYLYAQMAGQFGWPRWSPSSRMGGTPQNRRCKKDLGICCCSRAQPRSRGGAQHGFDLAGE